MASDFIAGLCLLVIVGVSLVVIIGLVFFVKRTTRWSVAYGCRERQGTKYWPAVTVVLIGIPMIAAVAVSFLTMLLGALLAPKQPYADGAGAVVVLLGMVAGAVAALACALVLFLCLVVRPLQMRRRQENT